MIKHLTPRPTEEIKSFIRSDKMKARKKRLWKLSSLGIYFIMFVVFFILRKIDSFKWDKPYKEVSRYIIDTINNKRKSYVDIETTNLYNNVVFYNNRII